MDLYALGHPKGKTSSPNLRSAKEPIGDAAGEGPKTDHQQMMARLRGFGQATILGDRRVQLATKAGTSAKSTI